MHKISLVSYVNALPFLKGIEWSDFKNSVEIRLENPANSAKALKNGEVDIALLPVGALSDFEEYHIFSDYCIGCDGRVDTVGIFTRGNIKDIQTLYLDNQSRTSVLLAQVLLKEHWKINPIIQQEDTSKHKNLTEKEGCLVIGDRAAKLRSNKNLNYYDLGEYWKKMTDLPFAFAVWVSLKPLDNKTINAFNQAFSIGMKNIDKIISEQSNKVIGALTLEYYFKQSIDYKLDKKKKTAITTFQSYL